MSKTIKLRKGLDIRLVGVANKVKTNAKTPKTVSLKPIDFHGMIPRMLVKEGESVRIGSIIFKDKYRESIKFASPVNGKVQAIIRGEKRRILEVVIDVDENQEATAASPINISSMSGEDVKLKMLDAGLWPFVRQRPIDIVADPKNEPKAIFISAFDSSPLAPDLDFVLNGKSEEFQAGLDVLTKLTSGKVHLTLNAKSPANDVFKEAKGVDLNTINGKHPAGNVGTQIHHIDPINKGEFVWTLNAQDVALIGQYFLTGTYASKRTIAVTGSEIKDPQYFEVIQGTNVSELLQGMIIGDNVRVISGNVLTGTKIAQDGHLCFYSNQITVIPEGDDLKFVLTEGWLGLGFDKFSNSRLFPTFLNSKKKFTLDTNTNGEERAFVMTGEMEKVFPFDIMPMHIAKAAITDNIDGMENLGIYEVIPEDFALCEYVCTTKINIQDKIRKGLDLINEECM
ncbi:Na(+)-translocating NADH-quinone reductase subunit A [Crocinitomicaceae bacterium]|nr:Na(+)-translocating NADH-quinone reductase subunit A [Crocinitomicaceae bacterium]